MANKEGPTPAPKPKAPKKPSYFPKYFIGFGLAIALVGALDFGGTYDIPERVHTVLLVIAGIWMFLSGIKKGFATRRKGFVKKYI